MGNRSVTCSKLDQLGIWAGYRCVIRKELAKRVQHVDYRLLIASAYSGFIIWHAGFSGSIPLSIATEGHPFVDKIGIIPTSATILLVIT